MKLFDKNLGKDFFAELPNLPGIYLVYNKSDSLIYVGKAKNLRRRLGQYRNAKRIKRHAKMRAIIKEANKIELQICASDYEACIVEAKMIQSLRPKWNTAGAFYFLYPLIGVAQTGRTIQFLFTTEPEVLPVDVLNEFSLHGSFRSRYWSGNSFFSLMALFHFLGHRNPVKKHGKYSYLYSFRQVEERWAEEVEKFLRGDKNDLLEKLILSLVESTSARKKPKEIQSHIKSLRLFHKYEVLPLTKARTFMKVGYPVSQKERDLLFLDYRFNRMGSEKVANT